MNEQQRQSYLRSMGYQVYYPRKVLAGAKPSPRYPVELIESEIDADSFAAPKTDVAPVIVAPSKSKAATQSIRAQFETAPKRRGPSAESESPVRQEAVVASSDTTRAAADSLQFSLQYFRINERLAVINEEPHQLRGRQNKETMTLLGAILKALLGEAAPAELQGDAFNWPLADGIEIAGDKADHAAGLALQGFIKQRHEQDGFTDLLMFTSQLAELVSGIEDNKALGDHELPKFGCRMTLTHSLQSMLVHPLLKREAWAHMQPLRTRLSSK